MKGRPPDCPECKRRMEPGYVLDYTYGGVGRTTWVAGTPEISRWTGLKLRGKAKIPITTFRCPHCGRLVAFAREE